MAGLLDDYRELMRQQQAGSQGMQPNLPSAMGQMPDMSALNQAGNLARLNQAANQAPPPQQPRSFGDRAMGILGAIGGGIKKRVQDPNFADRLVIGLGGMTMNPNEALMRQASANIEQRRKTDLLSAEANKTIEYLRSKGRDDLARMVESQPSTARAVLEEYLKAEIRPGAGLKTSAVMTDPNTGEQYVVATDPNIGDVYRKNVEGATSLTPAQELEMESTAALKEQDIQTAMNAGAKAFGQVESIDAQIDKLYEALGAVRDGAQSGVIRQFLPSFDAATAQLRAMGNALGIDIINSATFGALSAPELRLALSTGLDLSLSGKQLEDHIAAKIRAQTKLRNELYDKSRELTTGIGYSEFIQKNRVVPLAPPPGVDPLLWRNMLPEERQAYMEALGENQ
jgi:hypothetical protein